MNDWNAHCRPVKTWVGALLLLLVASACETGGTPDVVMDEHGRARVGPAEVTETVTRAVAPGDRTLVLNGFRGTILLEGTAASTAELEFTKRGLGGNEADAQESLGEIQVTEEGTAEEYIIRVESGDEDRTTADVRGTIPEGVSLRIEHVSGAVSMLGVTGPTRVEHENGPVDIRGAESSVTVSIKNGDVKVHYDQMPGDVSVDLSTANGDLELAMPRDASAQVDAQTSVGEVFVRGLTFDPQRLTPLRAGGRYTGQHGAGDATVTLRTKNGSIVLRQAPPMLPTERTMTQPPTEPDDTTQAAPDTTSGSPADLTQPDATQPEPAQTDSESGEPVDTANGDAANGDAANGDAARVGPMGPGTDAEDETMPPPDSLDPPTPTPDDAMSDDAEVDTSGGTR